jgi:hypothetical protein
MPTVVYRPKNKYAKNQPKNEYEYKNLNKRIDLLIGRVDNLLNRL